MPHQTLVCLMIALAALAISACGKSKTFVDRSNVEQAHGLKLPGSARNLQQKRSGGFMDRAILSMFEIDQTDVQKVIDQLKITSRGPPATVSKGDPCINGWNVWPKTARTFVPGNAEFEGLTRTWRGEAKPVEMLSCKPSKGDWLHVEIWSVNNHALIKLYTDWN